VTTLALSVSDAPNSIITIDGTRVIIYNHNMLIIQATGVVVPNKFLLLSMIFESEAETYLQILNWAKKRDKNKHSSLLCRTFRDEEKSLMMKQTVS